jgi:peptidoglycan/xylan/chitin deacetylase (PgdA/CDA1 family)
MHLLPTIALPTAAAVSAAATYVSLAPTSRFWGPVTPRGSASPPARYALTFDDGPTPGPTDAILDTLADLDAKAAFFLIGRNARSAPDLVKRIHDEGHLVANHSFDHSHFGIMRAGWYWHRQLHDTNALLHQITGQTPAFFRPPMGHRHFHIMRAARRNGLSVVTWTRRALDGIPTTPDRIVQRLAPPTQPGDILILHDGIDPNLPNRDPTPTVASIRPLITQLREKGLEPARLDDLIGIPASPT